jgi:hypothetical protein
MTTLLLAEILILGNACHDLAYFFNKTVSLRHSKPWQLPLKMSSDLLGTDEFSPFSIQFKIFH